MPLDSGKSGDSLVDVLDRVLDKGVVIDAAVRVSIVGIELLGVDARVVVASIETYLRHAEALAYTDMAAAPLRVRPDPPLFAEPAEPGPSARLSPPGENDQLEQTIQPGPAPPPEISPPPESLTPPDIPSAPEGAKPLDPA